MFHLFDDSVFISIGNHEYEISNECLTDLNEEHKDCTCPEGVEKIELYERPFGHKNSYLLCYKCNGCGKSEELCWDEF